ncbi:DNA primase [Candidatus Uhrbacteria bacterium]|jgi:DNA primase|nr:DNA primase [Candidatus Uhrbacteria bacterium]
MDAKEQIREKIDVADLVGEYLQCKPAGQGAFKALCPFHSEKTASFYISRPKQIWHCFGCDKGGDIFSFVMEMEGMDFPEALKLLAGKAGVELPKYTKGNDDRKGRMKDINGFAEKVYIKFLKTAGGKVARDYITSRGFDGELVAKFGFGYSPNAWTSLIDFARQKKIGSKELMDAGLASQGKMGAIDKFRNRLMIPLRDHHGNTVGFTARVLDPNDKPKYMNSPQTPIYDKGALLYGLDLAKTPIKKKGEVVIVEGNLDVVASHMAGVENVVASSGTALTDRQINLLKRYTNTLVFSFDTDAAGFEAARRGMRLASSMGCNVRVAVIPPELGKDPDDLVQKDPKLWQEVASRHVDKMQFLFDRIVGGIDPRNVDEKKKAGVEFLPEVASLADTIEREHWLKRFSDHVDIGVDVLRGEIERYRGESAKVSAGNRSNEKVAASQAPRNDDQGLNSNVAKDEPAEVPDKLLDVLYSIAFSSKDTAKTFIDHLPEAELPEGWYKMLYIEMIAVYNAVHTQSPEKSYFEALRSHLLNKDVDVSRVDRLALLAERQGDSKDQLPNRDATTELTNIIDQFKERSKKSKRQVILAELRRAEQLQDSELVADLTRRYQTLL